MIGHTAGNKHHRYDHLGEQPNDDVERLRAFEEIAGILDAQNRLANHNGTVDPALGAEPFASSIRHIDIILPVDLNECNKS